METGDAGVSRDRGLLGSRRLGQPGLAEDERSLPSDAGHDAVDTRSNPQKSDAVAGVQMILFGGERECDGEGR